jgi:hypothetical protein
MGPKSIFSTSVLQFSTDKRLNCTFDHLFYQTHENSLPILKSDILVSTLFLH